jgi:hypothetical protein
MEFQQVAPHFAKFYTDTTYYKLSEGLHYNTVVDHPNRMLAEIQHLALLGKW